MRIVSHLDADGLSSAGIMISTLKRLNVPFHLSVVKYLSESLVEELRKGNYSTYLFLDLGSGDLELLRSLGGKVFVVDHHKPPPDTSGINLLNPFLEGIDGDQEISSSGICFLIQKELLGDISMAPIALVGALGDVQEDGGFKGLNELILNWAVERGFVEVRRDIKLFGGPDYPLVPSLERTVDPFIRGISNDSAGALSLVESAGIPIKIGEKWVTLSDLTEDQKRNIMNELVKRIGSLDKAKLLIGNIYLNLREPRGSPLRDLASFSTLLNACGRMGKGYLGALLASGIRGELLNRVVEVQQEYRSYLSKLLSDLKPRVVGRIAFIDEGLAQDTVIGTLTSMLSRNMRDVELVVGYAETQEDVLKVSVRLTAKASQELDLDDVMRRASSSVGGRGGGHKQAAGAQIPKAMKRSFEESLINYLE
ncbi:MAG: DHH family phosphoesterase [Candidatus Korarchaeum sp.]|nr:DHH family phosphoesterase [Candidatus Korarchaeum sp.]